MATPLSSGGPQRRRVDLELGHTPDDDLIDNVEVPSDASDPPSRAVAVDRLRTEATTWINAVALQAGRIDRRHRNRHLESAEAAALEADLHFLLVALIRLRRCISRVGGHVPEMQQALELHLRGFDDAIPSLARLRNVSEHIDEYNLDLGRDSSVRRGQVQTWHIDSTATGSLIWGWLGERLDVEGAYRSALVLYERFCTECEPES